VDFATLWRDGIGFWRAWIVTLGIRHGLFARLGRPAQRAIYGLANLPRRHARADIEAVCARLLEAKCASYAAVKRALERKQAAGTAPGAAELLQSGADIRPVTEYQAFWETHSQTTPPKELTDANVDHGA